MQETDIMIQKLERLLRQINHQNNISTRRYLAERGMTMARFWVINNLSFDKPLTMGELQKQLCLSPGTLTGLVDGLVEGELVRRRRDEDDRRLVYLTLSEQGQAFFEDVINYRAALLQSIIKDKKNIDIEQLNHGLQYILDRFEII